MGQINLLEAWLGLPETPPDELKLRSLEVLKARKTELDERLKR